MAAPRFRVRTLLQILAERNPLSVLDLGCGDGSLLRAIHAVLPKAQLAGIDLSEAQIDENRRHAPQIEWRAGNLEQDDAFVLSRAYDAIVCSELIEHLADPARFLRSLHRVAAPHALLVLSTQSGRVGETERRVGHLRHFTAAELREMLQQNGWSPERVWNAGFPFQDFSKWLANLAPDASMRRFGERPYGPAERCASFLLRALFHLNSNRRGAQLFGVARRSE